MEKTVQELPETLTAVLVAAVDFLVGADGVAPGCCQKLEAVRIAVGYVVQDKRKRYYSLALEVMECGYRSRIDMGGLLRWRRADGFPAGLAEDILELLNVPDVADTISHLRSSRHVASVQK